MPGPRRASVAAKAPVVIGPFAACRPNGSDLARRPGGPPARLQSQAAAGCASHRQGWDTDHALTEKLTSERSRSSSSRSVICPIGARKSSAAPPGFSGTIAFGFCCSVRRCRFPPPARGRTAPKAPGGGPACPQIRSLWRDPHPDRCAIRPPPFQGEVSRRARWFRHAIAPPGSPGWIASQLAGTMVVCNNRAGEALGRGALHPAPRCLIGGAATELAAVNRPLEARARAGGRSGIPGDCRAGGERDG